jgi:hypothetical protein
LVAVIIIFIFDIQINPIVNQKLGDYRRLDLNHFFGQTIGGANSPSFFNLLARLLPKGNIGLILNDGWGHAPTEGLIVGRPDYRLGGFYLNW